MSNLEETEEVPILSLESLNGRRDKLYELLGAINNHEIGLTKYHTSEERVAALKKSRQKYIEKQQSIEEKNKILLKKINEEPVKLEKLNSYNNDVNDLLNTNPFLVPNVKVQKIKGYYGSDSVNGIILELSDTGTREYGHTNTSGGGSVEYALEPTEFIVKIDKVESSTAGTLGNALIFYTSAGRKHIVKGKNTEIDPSKFSEEKIFAINPTYQRWEWHEAEAKKHGYTLASIADSGESNKISNLMRQYGFGSAWAGGRRTRRGRSRGADSWKWVDGSPWNYTSPWGGGQPNDCCGGQDYLHIESNGRWNDLDPDNLPGVYSRKATRYSINSVTSGASDMEILGLNSASDLTVETDNQYITDTKAIDNLEQLKDDVNELIGQLDNDTDDAQVEYAYNLKIISSIKRLVTVIDTEINNINNLNASAKSGFTNMGTKVNNFFNNIFSNNKSMKEGFKEGLNSPFYDYMLRLFRDTRQSVNDELGVTDRIEYEENRNYMLELLAQKDKVLGNVLMDYMINDTEGSNAEQLYEIMNQENQDKKRKIKINDYYSKTYVEYSHILKIIILLVAIMIPFLILAKYEIIDKNISLSAVIIITFLGFLYVLYRLYLLYMKDNINFDKDRIPYDRQAGELMKQGRIKQKTGIQGLGITCIGEECCSEGMAYDNTEHKCFPLDPTTPTTSTTTQAESFNNFFESMNNMKNNQKSNVKQNNIHEDSQEFTFIEPFMSSVEDTRRFKTDSLLESLNNSTENNMFFNKQ